MSVRRRGNGLSADSYVLLLDVDPRLADPLLAALATAGVAAYTTPTTGRIGPFLEMHPPARPLEAVHVDSTRRPAARRVLETTMPDVTVGMPSIEEEDVFAALIAGWDDEPDEHPWPDTEDLDGPRPPIGDSEDLSPGPPRRRRTDVRPADRPADSAWSEARPTDTPRDAMSPETASPETAPPETAPPETASSTETDATGDARPETDLPDAAAKPSLDKPSLDKPHGASRDPDVDADGDSGADADDPTADHYLPPDVPPLPPSHPVTKWGLVALGVGLVLLIFPTLLGLEHTTGVDVVGVLSILGAVGLLVSRLSSRSTDEYDGPDDGAVV